jgi:preprotein translocase subunit SecB
MTNETTPPAAEQTMTVPMTILSQYVKDLSFENPNAPGILSLLAQTQPQVTVNVSVSFRALGTPPNAQAPLALESVVTIKGEGQLQNQPAFVVECAYGGLFTLPQGLPDHVVRGLMLVEAPRLLFPFARQMVSEAVMNGGYGPLLVAPVDFMALHQQQVRGEQLAAQPQAGNA